MMSFLLSLEPTLTIANLRTALQEVELGDLDYIFNVPESRQGGTKEAIIEEFIQNHPAPSWKLIADCLYTFYERGKYHTVLQNIKRKYLKGKEVILCTCQLTFVVINDWLKLLV